VEANNGCRCTIHSGKKRRKKNQRPRWGRFSKEKAKDGGRREEARKNDEVKKRCFSGSKKKWGLGEKSKPAWKEKNLIPGQKGMGAGMDGRPASGGEKLGIKLPRRKKRNSHPIRRTNKRVWEVSPARGSAQGPKKKFLVTLVLGQNHQKGTGGKKGMTRINWTCTINREYRNEIAGTHGDRNGETKKKRNIWKGDKSSG